MGFSMTVSADGHWLRITSPTTENLRLNRFWLRDLCPSLPSKESGLRTFSVASLAEMLAIEAVSFNDDQSAVEVEWNDGHSSVYKVEELLALIDKVRGRRPPMGPVTHFDATVDPVRFRFQDLAAGSIAHHDLLDTVAQNGFALVTNIDSTDDQGSTEALAALLGRVRETDFGRIFDIITEPETWTLSQSNVGQDPHSDDPFRYAPSGISILHCHRAAEGDGGTSLVVDGFKVAEDIRAEDPDAFHLLSTIPIPFVRRRSEAVDQGEDVNMVAYAPVITTSALNERTRPTERLTGARRESVVGIRFHERSTGIFDVDPGIVDAYFLAFRAFATRVRSTDYQFRHRLADGEAIVFDNQRVLHGRTGYESDTTGRRHIRLCTVDRDQVHSRLRRLRETHDLPGIDQRLHPGSSPA